MRISSISCLNNKSSTAGSLILPLCFLLPLSTTLATPTPCPTAAAVCATMQPNDRMALWLDLYRTEPVPFETVIEDLGTADIVYLGETHTLRRHHHWQVRILEALGEDKTGAMVLGIEQIEHIHQPQLDRFNAGSIHFEQLAEQIGWEKSWSNYRDYRELLETAQANGITVLALNAPADLIRKIGRQGLDSLSPDERANFPEQMMLDDPDYKRLLGHLLKGMAHVKNTDSIMERIFTAQVCRDEHMAATLTNYLRDNPASKAVVLTGSGHIAYGLGTVDRVRRHLPDSSDRIVLMSVSGELELTDSQKAFAGDNTITHADLRFLARPKCDYLQLTEPKQAAAATPNTALASN